MKTSPPSLLTWRWRGCEMEAEAILKHLAEAGAVLTNRHFVFSKGGHGTGYIDMRRVGHQSSWLDDVADGMAEKIKPYRVDLVVGPETLGRSLAEKIGAWLELDAIWCDVEDAEGEDKKVASFNPKFDFGRLIKPGVRVAIVDDLLTTGSSLLAVAELVKSVGGEVAVAVVVVRRTPDVTAANVGADNLVVMAEIDGFALFTAAECAAHGPCSKRVPVTLRPGHGHKWIQRLENAGYPTA